MHLTPVARCGCRGFVSLCLGSRYRPEAYAVYLKTDNRPIGAIGFKLVTGEDDGLDPSELNYLERKIYDFIQEIGRYELVQKTPHLGDIKEAQVIEMNNALNFLQCALGIFGLPALSAYPAEKNEEGLTIQEPTTVMCVLRKPKPIRPMVVSREMSFLF